MYNTYAHTCMTHTHTYILLSEICLHQEWHSSCKNNAYTIYIYIYIYIYMYIYINLYYVYMYTNTYINT